MRKFWILGFSLNNLDANNPPKLIPARIIASIKEKLQLKSLKNSMVNLNHTTSIAKRVKPDRKLQVSSLIILGE